MTVLLRVGSVLASDDSGDKPVVLFLTVGENDQSRKMESLVTAQLELTLFEFQVIVIMDGLEEFVSATLSIRLKTLKQMAASHKAIAIVWIEQGSENITLLNLVALSTGQALVRIVEAQQGPETPADLALAVQELLGQAYLFQRPPMEPELRQVVNEVADDAVAAMKARGEEVSSETEPSFYIVTSGLARGSIAASQGSGLRFGGALAVHHRFHDNLYWFPTLSLFASPKQRVDGDLVSSGGIALGIGLGYRLQHKRFLLLSALSISPELYRTDIGFSDAGASTYSWLNFATKWSFGFQVAITDRFFIGLEPSAVLNTTKQFYHRQSDNNVVFASSRVDWETLLSLGFGI